MRQQDSCLVDKNKTNSTARAVQLEANLTVASAVFALFKWQIRNNNVWSWNWMSSHGVQRSRWCRSMVNINIYRCHHRTLLHYLPSFPGYWYLQFLSLKVLIKVIHSNICNGTIRWQILESINIISRMFALALAVSEISSFQICDVENYFRSRPWSKIFVIVPFDDKYKGQ